MIVPVELSRVAISENSHTHMIWLKEMNGNRSFPILIGVFEALAIERHLRGESFPRPLTHDLLAGVIKGLKASLKRVVVTDIRNSTFFAKLVIQQNSSCYEVDSRPSDAIALATQMKAPIFVEDEVLRAVCTPDGLLETFDLGMDDMQEKEAENDTEGWQMDDDSDADFDGDEDEDEDEDEEHF
jgi:bifunctional DNase/RNase